MAQRKYNDDDGRVIADMSGIDHRSVFTVKKPEPLREPFAIERELSVWKMTWLALRLVMPLVFSFLAAVALFLLFCQFVWLR